MSLALEQEIKQLTQAFHAALKKVTTPDELEQVRIHFLGRKGRLTELVDSFKTLTTEHKRILGPQVTSCKQELTDAYTARLKAFEVEAEYAALSQQRSFDVTAYLPQQPRGTLHPMTQFLTNVEDIFISMGYEIVDGPEVEDEYHNFEALNIPPHHPARDMWDTFWLDVPGMLLRTHTSSVQVRCMEQKTLPIAILAPGRCYRHEATDASHDYVFMQAEGLVIGKGISFSHLLGTAEVFLKALFDKKNLRIRVRPFYFPFVEPGIEIDVSCPLCRHGCSVCKKTGWIEVCGAGLVHPNVLKCSGIDSNIYTGFAFGFGLGRLAMIRYGIDDIRLLHLPRLDFLRQF